MDHSFGNMHVRDYYNKFIVSPSSVEVTCYMDILNDNTCMYACMYEKMKSYKHYKKRVTMKK